MKLRPPPAPPAFGARPRRTPTRDRGLTASDQPWATGRTGRAAGAGRAVMHAGHGTRKLYRWVRAAPDQRAPLFVAPVLYGSGAAVHAAELPATGIAPVAVGAACVVYARTLKRCGEETRARVATAGFGATAGWFTLAAEAGVTGGPAHAMAWAYVALAAGLYGAWRHDTGTRGRIAWRKRRQTWRETEAEAFGLEGSHLLKHDQTRLGERLIVHTKGTGKRASQLIGRSLEELIAEYYNLPPERVQTRRHRLAGRIEISIRHRDPWATPIKHPLLDKAPEIELPVPGTVTKPLVIGLDPETGRPLTITLYNTGGGRHTMVIAVQGGGKSVFLNCLLERLTAATDAAVWAIAVAKPAPFYRWAPSLDLHALGHSEHARAIKMLRLARQIIDHRAEQWRDTATFLPTAADPLIAIVVEEMQKLYAGPYGDEAKRHVGYITTTGRSEAVVLVELGQRATINHAGSGDVRSQINNVVLLKTTRLSEVRHALGELAADLPDITAYGEGNGGVLMVAETDSGDHDQGRTFFLEDFADIQTLTTGRTPTALGSDLPAKLRATYQELKTTQTVPGPGGLGGPGREGVGGAAAGAATEVLERPGTPWATGHHQVGPGPGAGGPDDHARAPEPVDGRGQEEEMLATYDQEFTQDLEPDLLRAWDNIDDGKRLIDQRPEIRPPSPENAERHARMVQARNHKHAREHPVPQPQQDRLLELLAAAPPTGLSSSELAEELEFSKRSIQDWLRVLLIDGVVVSTGKARSTRWHLANPTTTGGEATPDTPGDDHGQ